MHTSEKVEGKDVIIIIPDSPSIMVHWCVEWICQSQKDEHSKWPSLSCDYEYERSNPPSVLIDCTEKCWAYVSGSRQTAASFCPSWQRTGLKERWGIVAYKQGELLWSAITHHYCHCLQNTLFPKFKQNKSTEWIRFP